MRKQKQNIINTNGITLVALVVTIVVLLILAGVSINLVVGDNGIITQARKAREETNKANENEMSQLDKLAKSLDSIDYEGGSWSEKNIYVHQSLELIWRQCIGQIKL